MPEWPVDSRRPRTFISALTILGGLALAGFAIIAALELAVWTPADANPDTLPNELFGATIFALFLTFFLHFAHCRIIASPTAITVVQPLRRNVLPWEQVADVVVSGDGGLRLVLADGSAIAVACFGGSLLGAATGGIQAKKARDGILEIAAQAAPDEPPPPASSASAFEWKIALGLWASLLAMALIGWFFAPHHVLA